jgi:predicted dehydrogenase
MTNEIVPETQRIRYAVVGLGNIAQVAVLPSFAHAEDNSELVALVSSDEEKLSALAKTYGVEHTGSVRPCILQASAARRVLPPF